MRHVYKNQNISHYFNYLSPQEQIKELHDLIAYSSKDVNGRIISIHNYSKIVSLKNIKREIKSKMDRYIFDANK